MFVEGRLQTSSYEKNGEKRYSTDIVASNIVLPGGRGRGEGAPAREGGGASAAGGGRGGYRERSPAPSQASGGSEPPFDDFPETSSPTAEDDIPF